MMIFDDPAQVVSSIGATVAAILGAINHQRVNGLVDKDMAINRLQERVHELELLLSVAMGPRMQGDDQERQG